MVGGSLTVGRGEENDLALPDPDRLISKRHCVLEERGGDYVIIDISTNGTFLNYSPERIGELPAPLNDGDVITLGSYELVVEIADGRASRSDPFADIAPPLDAGPISPGQAVDDRAASDFVGTLDDPAGTDGDFLDDLLAPAPTPDGAPPRPSWERAVIPEDPLESPSVIPEAEDPFFRDELADPLRHGGASAADHSASEQDFFSVPKSRATLIPDDWDEEFAGIGSPSSDSATAAPPAAPMPPVADPFAVAPTPGPARAVPASDPLGELLGESRQMEIPEDEPDDLLGPPSSPASPEPPSTPATPPATAAAAAQPAPTPISGAEAAAVRAFLEAAGAEHLKIPDEELVEVMARLGGAFRTMVAGIREVLMTRASIKGEFRMNQTMIRSGGNNPLKFSISAEQAVEAMIRPAVPGYQEAGAAAQEALNDIKAHEVATMTGMEAALKDLLARLNPSQLTGRIEGGSGIGSLLGGKKARYWEAYEKMYGDIARQAEDDFQSVFGKEFARAYEQQLRKL